MTNIVRAIINDVELLADLGTRTFIESHGSSAKQEDLDFFIREKYSHNYLYRDVSNPKNIYHIIYQDNVPAGFSKIIFNTPGENIEPTNVTKLEKIFLLKHFYNLKLGAELFNYNVIISKEHDQSGIWLFVWIKNERALSFYKKNGFKIVANYDFKISENHSNPNYQMFLKY